MILWLSVACIMMLDDLSREFRVIRDIVPIVEYNSDPFSGILRVHGCQPAAAISSWAWRIYSEMRVRFSPAAVNSAWSLDWTA